MGAEMFEDVCSGESVEAAFKERVDEALYWHGHNGHTGTIAEKDGFKLFEAKNDKVYYDVDSVIDHLQEGKETTLLTKIFGDQVADMIETFSSKWGPAVAFAHPDEEDHYVFCGWASS